MLENRLLTEEQSPSFVVHDKAGQARTEAIEKLIATIESEAFKRRRRRVWYKRAVFAAFLLLFIFGLVAEARFRFNFWFYWGALGAGAVFEVLATRKERAAAKQLAQLDDPRATGPLIDALELHGDTFDDTAAIIAIKESLARLLKSSEPILTPRQLNILSEATLDPENGSDLVVGTLRTLQRHAHTEVMDSVEALAEMEESTEESRDIKIAAAECLKVLQEAERRMQEAGTLLRPSAESGDAHLLRAASGGATVESESLLRAADSG